MTENKLRRQGNFFNTLHELEYITAHNQCVSSGTFYNMRILLRVHNNKSIIITNFEFQ